MFKLIQSSTCLQTLPTWLSVQRAGLDPSTHPTNEPACACLPVIPTPAFLLLFALRDPSCIQLKRRFASAEIHSFCKLDRPLRVRCLSCSSHKHTTGVTVFSKPPQIDPTLVTLTWSPNGALCLQTSEPAQQRASSWEEAQGPLGGLHRLAVLPEDWGQADVLGGTASALPPMGAGKGTLHRTQMGHIRALSRGIATLPQPGSFLAPSDSLNMRIGRGNNIC